MADQLARARLGTHEGLSQAYARIYQLVKIQAASLAYRDAFMVLCIGSAIMFLLAFILEKNEPGAGGRIAVK